MTCKHLGQVFTQKQIADYMVGLFSVGKNKTILDPCFGEGVFLDSLSSNYHSIIGIELDKKYYDAAQKRLTYEGGQLQMEPLRA